jgi:hypothetical protein
MTQPVRAATKHYQETKFSVMIITLQTSVALNVRADLSSYSMIAKTIDSRWSKIPSAERPTWAKSQEQSLENKGPILAGVKQRGSRAYTQQISANQALDIKRPLPSPNPDYAG